MELIANFIYVHHFIVVEFSWSDTRGPYKHLNIYMKTHCLLNYVKPLVYSDGKL